MFQGSWANSDPAVSVFSLHTGCGSPSCPVPREPAWHLVLKVALLKCHIEQLQLVAQVGLPPSLGLADPWLVAKLVVEYVLWQQTHVSVQQEGEN